MAEPSNIPDEFWARILATNPSTQTTEEEALEAIRIKEVSDLQVLFQYLNSLCEMSVTSTEHPEYEYAIDSSFVKVLHIIAHEWVTGLEAADSPNGRAYRMLLAWKREHGE